MKEDSLLQIRITGVLIEDNKILIVKQKITPERSWSLPGGRVQKGEMLEEAIIREMREETGLQTSVTKLLYVCDYPEVEPPILHISFLLDRIGGEMRLPSNEFDENPIFDVKMVPIDDLPSYDFSDKFKDLVQKGFPDAGVYKGHKRCIGL